MRVNKEQRPNLPLPETKLLYTFPIEKDAIEGAFYWLNNITPYAPELFEEELNDFKEFDPPLARYIEGMMDVRSQLQFTEEQQKHYYQGVIFAVNFLENQIKLIDDELDLPSANPKALDTYFKSLVLNEHIPISNADYSVLSAAQPGLIKNPLTPQGLAYLNQKNISSKETKRVSDRFRKNSSVKLKRMFESEKNLREELQAIYETVGNGSKGFYYGMLDIYEPYKIDTIIGPFAKIIELETDDF